MNIKNIINEVKKDYLYGEKLINPWSNSEYEWIKNQSTCFKGKIGEEIIKRYFLLNNKDVDNRTSIQNDGVFDGYKSEVKLSCLNKSGMFKWLQIRPDDDYELLYLISVTPDEIELYKLDKDFIKELISKKEIKPQHGGIRNHSNIYYLGLKKENLPIWLKERKIKISNKKK